MPCPRCVGECRCSLGAEQDHTVLVDPEGYDPSEEQFSQSLVSARLSDFCELPPASAVQKAAPNDRGWRREVSQRVTRFRTRRGLPVPEASMSFDFEAASPEAAAPAAPAGAVLNAPDPDDARQELKVIKFPRLTETEQPGLLAAPVEELAPRIFEDASAEMEYEDSVEGAEYSEETADEAELMENWNTSVAIAPALPSFTLDAATPEAEPAGLTTELPIQMAPVGLRGIVVLLDGLVALAAAGLFSYLADYFGALPADPKILLAVEVLAVVFFWFTYQLLYLTYAGKTLGMVITRVDLCTFEGEPVSRLRRQARAFSMLLSVLAAGLGYIWVLFDEDALCWHDRITRTVMR